MTTPKLDLASSVIARTEEALSRYQFDHSQVYYTFADKAIVPTFLSRSLSRTGVNVNQAFHGVHSDLELFPAFGASMSFMRSRFARDVWEEGRGGVHILPRVGLSDAGRLEDVRASAPVLVGVALGIFETDDFLKAVFQEPNLAFASIDIAHGANVAVLPLLERIIGLGVKQGIILGNVGSVEGFVFAYWLMKLSGFQNFVIKVGVGPGSVCTTRINTGVGVGQLTVLEQIYAARAELGYFDAQLISDGGVNAAGDFVKALVYSEGVMMGKFFASGSFEDEVLILEGGKLVGVQLFGMASTLVTEKRNFIEGSSQTLHAFHQNAGEAVTRLREGLQSAMTYVNSSNLQEFRKNVRFAINSAASMTEGGVH